MGTAVLRDVQVSTIDAFQGGEKDIIILSCVRTKHVGFIDSEKYDLVRRIALCHLISLNASSELILICVCCLNLSGGSNQESTKKQHAKKIYAMQHEFM